MPKQASLKKNLGYQTAYQILTTCLPLVTSPYLSRVLGAEGLGIFSFSNSIVSYFTLFALLGVANYGMRTIAQSSKSIHTVSKAFWSIYIFQILASVVSLIAYLILIAFVLRQDAQIYLLQGLLIVAALTDVSWLFFGLEQFKITVIRNTIIKLITFISIFVFVKTDNDLPKYIFIMSAGTLLGNLSLWIPLKKYICFEKVSVQDVIYHIKPNLILFIPVLASTVYHIMDKTMLGMFAGETESGFYYNADKVVNIPLSIINGCCAVFMSNISVLIKEKAENIKNVQKKCIEICMLLVSIMAFGIAAVSDVFCPVFFGPGFDPCIGLTYYFAVIMIVKTISFVTRSAYLIPNGYDKFYIISIIAGAGFNLVCNYGFIVILQFGAFGATLGTLIAETIVAFVQVALYLRYRDMSIVRNFISTLPFFIIGGMMLLVILLIAHYLPQGVVGIIIRIAIGGTIYLGVLLLYYRFTHRDIRSAFKLK